MWLLPPRGVAHTRCLHTRPDACQMSGDKQQVSTLCGLTKCLKTFKHFANFLNILSPCYRFLKIGLEFLSQINRQRRKERKKLKALFSEFKQCLGEVAVRNPRLPLTCPIQKGGSSRGGPRPEGAHAQRGPIGHGLHGWAAASAGDGPGWADPRGKRGPVGQGDWHSFHNRMASRGQP